MAITVKGNIPTKPDGSTTETTLNVQVAGGNGTGQEADGFISVQIATALVSALNAGPCTVTITQP